MESGSSRDTAKAVQEQQIVHRRTQRSHRRRTNTGSAPGMSPSGRSRHGPRADATGRCNTGLLAAWWALPPVCASPGTSRSCSQAPIQLPRGPRQTTRTIPCPGSRVRVSRNSLGTELNVAVGAMFIASAPWQARAGPFLPSGLFPKPSRRGRCTSRVARLPRSNTVPIADLPVPMIRSPSQ